MNSHACAAEIALRQICPLFRQDKKRGQSHPKLLNVIIVFICRSYADLAAHGIADSTRMISPRHRSRSCSSFTMPQNR